MKNELDNIEKLQDFVDQKSNAKSPNQKCIKFLTKEANRNKLDYGQLRYIFRVVRENCDIEISKNKKSLYQLPTSDELAQFYSVINNPIHKLIFQFLQSTGLRVSELCNLEVGQIDFQENMIFIKEGKGKKDRVVPFGNKLKEKLGLYLETRNNRYLFESNRNSKYSTRRIEQICEKYLADCELPIKITPHTFRHIYFSFLARNKVSKEHRMLIAGHSSGKTQDIYTHLSIGGIKDEIIDILDRD
ncbi:tyrosine-type recombinase/integrase [Bacteriovoracaceae bacterium]|nr:tyrosine-type recombinase/integrase [Bacteriovoracaceae bacterium]